MHSRLFVNSLLHDSLTSSIRRIPSLSSSFSAAATATAAPTAPIGDPLELLKESSEKRGVCDADGFRIRGTHWPFALAVGSEDHTMAPNLRTIGFQRVTKAGIDFVVKHGASSVLLANKAPVSIMTTSGRYKTGETIEQWRMEGHCQDLDLDELIHKVAPYTITEMIASKRASTEKGQMNVDSIMNRPLVENKSHFVEIVQRTRNELENGDISKEELEECLKTFRFLPSRIERMVGGPELIMWERWEWFRSGDETSLLWTEPKQILPY